jgi:predicted nucleic acid-binding protein
VAATAVGFDTCVLGWAIQGYSTVRLTAEAEAKLPKDPAAIKRITESRANAVALTTELMAQRVPIAIPTVALGEFLCAVQDPNAVMAALARGFIIHPFDHQSARIAAELYKIRSNDGTYAGIRGASPGEEGLRPKLKADTQIVATAIRWQVSKLYSNDPDIRRIASGRLTVIELPPRAAKQLDIPGTIPQKKRGGKAPGSP